MIPIEIQSDQELYSIHLRIKSLRGRLHVQLEEVKTGIYSSKRLALDIIGDLFSNIDNIRKSIEVYVIPSEKINDFKVGLISIADYIGDDLLNYYNDMKKLSLYLQSILMSLNEIASYNTIRLSETPPNQSEFKDSISEEDFIEQGSQSPTGENITYFIYHIIGSNDTLQDLAEYYYGDRRRYIEIMNANDIRPSDLIDGLAIGNSIKIPMPQFGLAQSGRNRVYEKQPKSKDKAAVEKYLYGTDVEIRNGNIVINGNSTSKISGVQVVVQNIKHRLGAKKIGISSDQSWGLGMEIGNDNLPFLIKLERKLVRAESQCIQDPRVVSAFIPRETVKVNGDSFNAEVNISLIGADEERIKI